MGRKIISMCLYGDGPQYLKGAVENAKLVPEVYPGWTLKIYYHVAKDCPEIKELRRMGCKLVRKSRSKAQSGMFWRFLPAWEAGVERVIIRDTDSRINHREAAAVQAWEALGQDAHCMHDHPHHHTHPIFGGMWGIKGGLLPRELKRQCILAGKRRQPRVADMRWLTHYILPYIKGSLLRHSSIPIRWPSVPFPDHRPVKGFVGQQYDEEGNPIIPK